MGTEHNKCVFITLLLFGSYFDKYIYVSCHDLHGHGEAVRRLDLCTCRAIHPWRAFDLRMMGGVYIFEPNNIPLLLRAGRSGDRMPVGAKVSASGQTDPGVHPTSYTMGTGSFPGGVKRPGRGVDHPPSVPSWQIITWTYSIF